jgi:hypothetical protein
MSRFSGVRGVFPYLPMQPLSTADDPVTANGAIQVYSVAGPR